MTDATWGTSRGSRNRWKRFRRDEVPSAPALPEVIAKLRARFGAYVKRDGGGGDPISSPS
jgi:hypothetical protein